MALTAEQNPEQIFPEKILDEPVNGTVWWVAHTKSRREKALAEFLCDRAVGYYLPMVKLRQPSGRRTRFSLLPLFTGYLFFKGSAEQRYLAYASNHIARVLDVHDQEKLREELAHIARVLAANELMAPCDFFTEGQRVRVKYGPLKGVEGNIDRKNGSCRLVLSVSSIAQAFAVNIDAEMVEAV
jgi:transcription antitermination factor NusG